MKEILKQLFFTRKEFSKKFWLNERTLWGYIRWELWNKFEDKYIYAIKEHINDIKKLIWERQNKLDEWKKSYLKDIDLNNSLYSFILNTEECKIVSIELEIKHPQVSSSDSEWSVTFEWYLPTSFEWYERYCKGEVYQQIKMLKWYEAIWFNSDKYTLYITLIKTN